MNNQPEVNSKKKRKFMHLSKHDIIFFMALSAFILIGGLVESVGHFLLNTAVWGAILFGLLMVIGAIVWLYTPLKETE